MTEDELNDIVLKLHNANLMAAERTAVAALVAELRALRGRIVRSQSGSAHANQEGESGERGHIGDQGRKPEIAGKDQGT